MANGKVTIPDILKRGTDDYEPDTAVVSVDDTIPPVDTGTHQRRFDSQMLMEAVPDSNVPQIDLTAERFDMAVEKELNALRKTIKIMLSEEGSLQINDLEFAADNGIRINEVYGARNEAEKQKGKLLMVHKRVQEVLTKVLSMLKEPVIGGRFFDNHKRLSTNLNEIANLLDAFLKEIDGVDDNSIEPVGTNAWTELRSCEQMIALRASKGFLPLAVQRFRRMVIFLTKEIEKARLKGMEYERRVEAMRQFVMHTHGHIRIVKLEIETALSEKTNYPKTPQEIRKGFRDRIQKCLPNL